MHWTYEEFNDDSDLEQGDLVAPIDDLKGILKVVHPHFCADKYLGFTIATQSCDLVRRKHGAKAKYISIAVVRSLKAVFPRLLAQVVRPTAAGLFAQSAKVFATQFLERIFDQNEQALGLFYFHPDPDVELGEPAVAFLRVNVALREEHYDVLLKARTGRLTPEFREKFGWLLGNLYSRAATRDWSDSPGGNEQLSALIERYTKEQIAGAGPTWVEDELIEAGRVAGVQFDGRSHDEVIADLIEHRPKPRIDKVAEIAADEAGRRLMLNQFQLEQMRKRLREVGMARVDALAGVDAEIVQQLRDTVDALVEAAVNEARGEPLEDRLGKLRTKLVNNPALKKLLK